MMAMITAIQGKASSAGIFRDIMSPAKIPKVMMIKTPGRNDMEINSISLQQSLLPKAFLPVASSSGLVATTHCNPFATAPTYIVVTTTRQDAPKEKEDTTNDGHDD
jgi:hypothetical protein